MSAIDPEMRDELEATVADPGLDPQAKVAILRTIEEKSKGLLGAAQRHAADAEKLREAQASGQAHRVLRARENASIREEALRRGILSEDELDRAGYLSHEELDNLAQEGLLEQRLEELEGVPVETEMAEPEDEEEPEAQPEGGAEEMLTRAGTVTQETLLDFARRSGGEGTTAVQRGSGEGVWQADRQALHEHTVDAFFREPAFDETAAGGDGAWVPDPEGEPLRPEGERVAVLAAGGPASGKATLLAYLRAEGEVPENSVMLSFDQVAAMLPESADGRVNVYEEASALADQVFHEALERGFSMTVDGLFAESAASVARRVRALTSEGYRVIVLYVDVPTEEALRRLAERAEREGRMMPEVVARMAHRDSAATLLGLTRILQEDGTQGVEVQAWDNAQGEEQPGIRRPPRRIYSLIDGMEQVEDPSLWRRLSEKANERLLREAAWR